MRGGAPFVKLTATPRGMKILATNCTNLTNFSLRSPRLRVRLFLKHGRVANPSYDTLLLKERYPPYSQTYQRHHDQAIGSNRFEHAPIV